MSLNHEPPSATEVADALSSINWIYLDEGGDGGVFDTEMVRLESSGKNTYDVTIRAFSSWIDIPNSVDSSTEVSIYDFSFSVVFSEELRKWTGVENQEVSDWEHDPVQLESLDDYKEKALKLIKRNFDSWPLEDVAALEFNNVASGLRPHLECYIDRRRQLGEIE